MNTNNGCKQHKHFIGKIVFSILRKDGTVKRYSTQKTRRFYAIVTADNFQNSIKKVHLKVSYGRYETNFGKMKEFTNEGVYETYDDLIQAFQAFLEPD
jgi:hypothetical protein